MSAPGAALRVEIHLPLPQFQLECSFEAQNEVVVLFGASGAGKTSVLDCIAGFRSPHHGQIALGDRIVYSSERRVNLPVRQRRVGYLSQQLALFPHLSVRQNVEYGLLDLPRPERDSRVDSILRHFGIASLARSRPAAISGGEQQRVALARTLVCEPALLLLDEPLSALDLRLKSLLLEVLFDWQREHAVPLLYVTHEQSEAYSLSRRVLVMEMGRVVADGEPQRIFSAPMSRERAELSGYENIFDAVVEETHPAFGTMTCRIAGSDLSMESPLANKAGGEAACLALRAGDILVAINRPSGISARNVLQGRIHAIEDRAGMVELRVLCAASAGHEEAREATSDDVSPQATDFCVHITRGALQNLGLQRGQAVWLIIKTHSIQFLRS
jgi:molybdate transport system ATP-binding protein